MADDQDNGLSDEEYDALLQDLEGRAGEGEGSSSDLDTEEDLGDIDEFLASVETDESPETSTETATADEDPELAGEFAALEEEHGDIELSSDASPEAAARKKDQPEPEQKSGEEKKGAEGKKEGKPSSGRGKRVALFALKNSLWVIPALASWWVIGIYLGQWVSAGWLIAVVGAMFVFGIPTMVRRAVDRGNYRTWVGGLSLVATIGLIAPMPNLAGDRMAQYGHWPAATIAEVTQQDQDTGFVRAQSGVSAWLGGLVSTTQEEVSEARQLGTPFPLSMQWPPEDIENGEVPGVEGEADEPQPPAQEGGEPAQQQEATPEDQPPEGGVEIEEETSLEDELEAGEPESGQ